MKLWTNYAWALFSKLNSSYSPGASSIFSLQTYSGLLHPTQSLWPVDVFSRSKAKSYCSKGIYTTIFLYSNSKFDIWCHQLNVNSGKSYNIEWVFVS